MTADDAKSHERDRPNRNRFGGLRHRRETFEIVDAVVRISGSRSNPKHLERRVRVETAKPGNVRTGQTIGPCGSEPTDSCTYSEINRGTNAG